MKRTFAIVVAALFALTTYGVMPANADGGPSPITTPQGVRYDVDMYQVDWNSMLSVGNYTSGVIRVEYSDPTYGYQTATIAPGLENSDAMCADPAYQASNPVIVTFDANTSKAVTGTGKYAVLHGLGPQIAQTDMARAKAALIKAVKALKKAKKHHASSVKIKRLKRHVRVARTKLSNAQREAALVQKQIAYCASRRLN